MNRFVLLFLALITFRSAFAQNEPKADALLTADTTVSDTTGFYSKMYHYSKDKKLLYLLYQMVFNVSDFLGKQDLTLGDIDSISYRHLEGRTIGEIKIINYEPFGNRVTDTIAQKKSTAEKIGNKLHFKTKEAIIRNNLLFREGDLIDLYLISESERLVRSSQYLRDARIRLIETDSVVNVEVYTLDLWSLRIGMSLTGSKIKVSLGAYNVFGLGHRFKNKTSIRYKNIDNNQFEHTGTYFVPNIGSSFISSEFLYKFANNEEYKGISFQRSFYSSVARYAGGVEYLNRYIVDSIRLKTEGYDSLISTSDYYNVWVGRSFKIKKGKTVEERGSNFVLSTGYSKFGISSLETNSDLVRSYFEPYDLYLVEFGYSNRKFYTDRFVQKFGEREDIPTGRIMKFTTGYKRLKKEDDFYAGLTLGGSGFFKNESFISITSGYGTYLNSGVFSDGVIKTDWLYFSRLYGKSRWKLRWFLEGNLTTGIDRKFNEYIKLKEGNWIPGYNKEQPEGNTRFVVNLTAVLFNPFEWIGFKFTPVVFSGIGMVSRDVDDLVRARTYPGYGIGFAINNIYLVQSEIRFFFGYYHSAPGSDVRFSSFDAWDFEFRDFDFDKPETIIFE